jgi:hypothetical protein
LATSRALPGANFVAELHPEFTELVLPAPHVINERRTPERAAFATVRLSIDLEVAWAIPAIFDYHAILGRHEQRFYLGLGAQLEAQA